MTKRKPAKAKTDGDFHHGSLAEALVTRALEIIDTEGVDAVGVRRLARDLVVDPAAVYRHYRDLDALLGAAAQTCFTELSERTERAVASAPSPSEALRAAGQAYVGYALKHPTRFRAMFGARGSGPTAWPREPGVGSAGRTAWEVLEATLVAMHKTHPLRAAPKVAAHAAWAAVHGLAILLTEGPLQTLPPTARRAAIDTTLDMAIQGLATKD